MSIHDLPVKLAEHLFFTLASVAIGFRAGRGAGRPAVPAAQAVRRGAAHPVHFQYHPGIVFIGLLFLAWGTHGHRAGRPGDLRHLPGAENTYA